MEDHAARRPLGPREPAPPLEWRPVRARGDAGGDPRRDRSRQIARLGEAMSWPPAPERWRLDGEVRRRTAPLLGEIVGLLGRLKAVLAGLSDDDRPVVLDVPDGPAVPASSPDLAGFVPGRFVAVRWLEDEERRAPTNPFAGLADRALKLIVPELETGLTELTVLLNEYVFLQESELEEILDALPGETLDALERAMPGWGDDAPRRETELARLRAHLAERAVEPPRQTLEAPEPRSGG